MTDSQIQITYYGYESLDDNTFALVKVDGSYILKLRAYSAEWVSPLAVDEDPRKLAEEFVGMEWHARMDVLTASAEKMAAELKENEEATPLLIVESACMDEAIAFVVSNRAVSVTSGASDSRVVRQRQKVMGLMEWIAINSDGEAIGRRTGMIEQLETETKRLYATFKKVALEATQEAAQPAASGVKEVYQSDAQKRLAGALGLRYDASTDLSELISNEVGGYSVVECVFESLVTFTGGQMQNRHDGKVEYVTDGCPFCHAPNEEYIQFSFNNNGSFCFRCRESAGMIDTALAIRGCDYQSRTVMGNTNAMPLEEATTERAKIAKKQKGAKGKKSVWLGSYLKYNMRVFDLNAHDMDQVVAYFTDKGLRAGFVKRRLLPYLDAHNIRFNYCAYSYETKERGLALNVPYVAGNERVRAIKRRLMDQTLRQDAKRWNFNIYPKADHESALWTTLNGHPDLVVVVENQLDAAALNLMAEMADIERYIGFCAPLVPQKCDIAIGAQPFKDTSIIMLAYDADETGQHYTRRDSDRLGSEGFWAEVVDIGQQRSEGLLDTMIRRRIPVGSLKDKLMEMVGIV